MEIFSPPSKFHLQTKAKPASRMLSRSFPRFGLFLLPAPHLQRRLDVKYKQVTVVAPEGHDCHLKGSLVTRSVKNVITAIILCVLFISVRAASAERGDA